MKTHKHKAKPALTRERCFSGPVSGAEPNRAAHGNITVTEQCQCGATRKTNVNGHHVERGGWA